VKTDSAILSLESSAIPMHIVNPVIATISSKEAAAITSEGTPFSTPYPSFFNCSMPGTTMTGLTAPKINPNESANVIGMLKRSSAVVPDAKASITPVYGDE
jgi:hypothetical protein